MPRPSLRTREQRKEAGKALRDRCPRRTHGEVSLGQGERDVVELIAASNRGRLEDLIPIRHGRMLKSPFAFLRGSAAVQAYDLDRTPSSGIQVQACGDCHLMNFGGFATPERTLVFDINDFDETMVAPFEWDLKRLAASFVVAARWRGFRDSQAREIAVRAVTSYRESMHERAGTRVLDAWYSQVTFDDVRAMVGTDADLLHRVRKRVAEAHEQTPEHVSQKLTAPVRGLPRLVDQPPLLVHQKGLTHDALEPAVKRYRATLPEERRVLFDRFTAVDVARKVAGVGSVGTRCYVLLLLAAPDDPLFLQVKEARPSVLAQFTRHAGVANDAQRIVVGQRLMQAASDIFLGWSRGPEGRDFYLRQLHDMKVSPALETQTPRVMRAYAHFCGLALARAHAKAGDAAMIAGYLGTKDSFDRAIGDYAVGYADQVERDYAAFVTAVRTGKLKSDLSPRQMEAVVK